MIDDPEITFWRLTKNKTGNLTGNVRDFRATLFRSRGGDAWKYLIASDEHDFKEYGKQQFTDLEDAMRTVYAVIHKIASIYS